MRIIELTTDCEAWREFLNREEHRHYHTPKYKEFIEKTFKVKSKYFAYFADNKIKTLLPCFFVKSPLFGKRVISAAFQEYGGFAGEKEFVNDIVQYIEEKYSKDNDYLEIRHGLYNLEGFSVKKVHRFELALEDEATLWRRIQKEKRKAVKKASKFLDARELGLGDMKQLYKLYLWNMRAFGTPPYPKSFFVNFFNMKLGRCFGAFYQGKLTAFLLGYEYKDRIHVVIANSYPKYRDFRSNDAVHWAFIKHGLDKGFKVFDFGVAYPESGQFSYKKKWGAVVSDLNVYYKLWKGEIPEVDARSDKYKFYVGIWKKMPLGVTKVIGPWLRRGVGI
ncbi:GNAT family N-acetyltransferase [Candidatus Woesearchaeota archaeon]|nr:GNAT family N-acetyltransferase [Candidatus Woesearchaeota archaeon]